MAENSLIIVWHAHPWVVTFDGVTCLRGKFMNDAEGRVAAERLRAGADPGEIFGWTGGSLPLANVRTVEWVPAANTLLLKRSRWREAWRLTFAEGREAYRLLASRMPGATEQESLVGPNDLAMDPKVALGVVMVIAGLIALIGGAIEGAGPAAVRGRIFAVIGEEIGVVPALVTGAIAVIVGVGGLVWWYVKRPSKWVTKRATTV